MWSLSSSPPQIIEARVLTRLPDSFRKKRRAAWTSSFCSCLWLLVDPVAGLADSGRQMSSNGCLCTSREERCVFRKYHAPMFFGSSCTQKAGVPAG